MAWKVGAVGYACAMVFNAVVAAFGVWDMVASLAPLSARWWLTGALVGWTASTAGLMLIMDREAVRVDDELARVWPDR